MVALRDEQKRIVAGMVGAANPRATGDMDIWIALSPRTADTMVQVFSDFGFSSGLDSKTFLTERRIVRLGIPPNRLGVTTHIDGVSFLDCYSRRVVAEIGGVEVSLIGLSDLRANKSASGRLKDLADLGGVLAFTAPR